MTVRSCHDCFLPFLIFIHSGAAAHHEFSQVLLALCTTLRVNHDYHHPDAVSLRFLATSALQNWIRCPELDVNARAKFEFVNIAKVFAFEFIVCFHLVFMLIEISLTRITLTLL